MIVGNTGWVESNGLSEDPELGAVLPTSAGPPDDAGRSRRQLETTTILLYSSITILGVMAAAEINGDSENTWDLSLLVIGSAMALAVAHAWAKVLAEMMFGGHRPDRQLIWKEGRSGMLALVPALVVVVVLFLMDLTEASYETGVTVSMLAAVVVLFLTGYVGSFHRRLGVWTSLKWGSASAAVGLLAVFVKVGFGH